MTIETLSSNRKIFQKNKFLAEKLNFNIFTLERDAF